MPESLTTPNTIRESCDAHAFSLFMSNVVGLCFDVQLLDKQNQLSQYHPEYTPVQPGAKVVLGVVNDAITKIGDVLHIGTGATIDAGAEISSGCIIRSRASIGRLCVLESYVLVDHGVKIEPDTYIESGATICTGAICEQGSYIGTGSEIGYDVTIPQGTKVEPDHIITQGTDGLSLSTH